MVNNEHIRVEVSHLIHKPTLNRPQMIIHSWWLSIYWDYMKLFHVSKGSPGLSFLFICIKDTEGFLKETLLFMSINYIPGKQARTYML